MIFTNIINEMIFTNIINVMIFKNDKIILESYPIENN